MSKQTTKRDREGTIPTTNADEEDTDDILADAERNQTGYFGEDFLLEPDSLAAEAPEWFRLKS